MNNFPFYDIISNTIPTDRGLFYRKARCLLGNVRSIDIAHELSFSKPSVSVAMKNLRLNNYITVDENGYINLTDSGMAIAGKIYERHTFLTSFLISIGVDPETAAEDACKIEHVISSESFSALKKYLADNEKN